MRSTQNRNRHFSSRAQTAWKSCARTVLVVGDTPYDAEAAAKAKLKIVGVLCGNFAEKDLREKGCVEIYRDPVDLLANYEKNRRFVENSKLKFYHLVFNQDFVTFERAVFLRVTFSVSDIETPAVQIAFDDAAGEPRVDERITFVRAEIFYRVKFAADVKQRDFRAVFQFYGRAAPCRDIGCSPDRDFLSRPHRLAFIVVEFSHRLISNLGFQISRISLAETNGKSQISSLALLSAVKQNNRKPCVSLCSLR
jgi:hypothetical protein